MKNLKISSQLLNSCLFFFFFFIVLNVKAQDCVPNIVRMNKYFSDYARHLTAPEQPNYESCVLSIGGPIDKGREKILTDSYFQLIKFWGDNNNAGKFNSYKQKLHSITKPN